MSSAELRGALCLIPPPRYAELHRLVPGRAVLSQQGLLAGWGVPYPPPLGWKDALILRRLRIDNMVARRAER